MRFLRKDALDPRLHISVRPHELAFFGSLIFERSRIARRRTIFSLLAQILCTGVIGLSHGRTSLSGCRYGQGRSGVGAPRRPALILNDFSLQKQRKSRVNHDICSFFVHKDDWQAA
jgi:hypothetical protein